MYKIGSTFKAVGTVNEFYMITGGKKGSGSGDAFLASMSYGWNYTGIETAVDNYHEITEGEFNLMAGGHPERFEPCENPINPTGIIGAVELELERPICVIDLETTGVDPEKDFIVEICVLKLMPDGTEDIRTMQINPGIPIPAAATEVHGITDEMVKDAPTFAKISKSLFSFIDGCDIGGFNSNSFDVPMLNAMFTRVGIAWNWKGVNLIDVRNIFVQKEERTLSAAVKFYLGKDHEEAHSAEQDVIETKNILLAQLDKYPDLPRDMKGLAWFSNYSEELIDLARKFKKNEAGEIIFNFGTHKGKVAKTEKKYLEWMITKGDFTRDTKDIANLLSFQ